MSGRIPSVLTRLWRETRGNVSMELAVVVLVLVPLVLGAYDFGMGYREQLRLRSAARAGAQWAITNPTQEDEPSIRVAARADANDTTNSLTVDPISFTCQCPGITGTVSCITGTCAANAVPYKFVTVTVQGTYDPVFDYPGLPSTIAMAERAKLRIR